MDSPKLVVVCLSVLAALCIVVSAGVLYLNPEGARDIIQILFAPVTVAISGFVGFLKA